MAVDTDMVDMADTVATEMVDTVDMVATEVTDIRKVIPSKDYGPTTASQFSFPSCFKTFCVHCKEDGFQFFNVRNKHHSHRNLSTTQLP
jgi:hypothetical protein